MSARRRLLALVTPVGAAAVVTAAALAATAPWGTAIKVPGSAALNLGGDAATNSISCPTAGFCAAGGHYTGGAGHGQAFVVNKKHGVWGKAIRVPGSAALKRGGNAWLLQISCAGAGSCAAGGYYRRGSGSFQAFVVDEQRGVWGKAIEVPGTARLNVGGFAAVDSISCATADSCVAGGYYRDGSDHGHAFVVNERNGIWRRAIELPGSATLNLGGDAVVSSISCATAGSCAAGGYYKDGSGHLQALVANETNGVWRKAIEVPGTAEINVGGDARVTSISCATAGSCAAGGFYSSGAYCCQAFVADETNGIWNDAVEVPGSADLNLGGYARVDSISCAGPGSCAAGGIYAAGSPEPQQAFVVNETNGIWGEAVELPGSADLNLGGDAAVTSISCAIAGSCAAVGYYRYGSDLYQDFEAFVVNETNGVWNDAIEVPGTDALNLIGRASANSISCATARSCAVGGFYTDSAGQQAFVTSP